MQTKSLAPPTANAQLNANIPVSLPPIKWRLSRNAAAVKYKRLQVLPTPSPLDPIRLFYEQCLTDPACQTWQRPFVWALQRGLIADEHIDRVIARVGSSATRTEPQPHPRVQEQVKRAQNVDDDDENDFVESNRQKQSKRTRAPLQKRHINTDQIHERSLISSDSSDDADFVRNRRRGHKDKKARYKDRLV